MTDKTRNPNFNYKHTHELEIDEDLVAFLLSNTLTIGIWGKVESKSSKYANKKNKDGKTQLNTVKENNYDFDSDDEDGKLPEKRVIKHGKDPVHHDDHEIDSRYEGIDIEKLKA